MKTWKKSVATGLVLALILAASPMNTSEVQAAAYDGETEFLEFSDGEARTASLMSLADSDTASGSAASGSAVDPTQTAKPDDDKPEIGEEAMDEDSHLKYEVTDEITNRVGVIITDFDAEYYEKIDTVTIPETIDGYPVLFIGDYAFGNSKFKSITLPSKLEQIGSSAFYECEKLKSIEIPAGVTEIESDAFYGCI